ncbi:MAG: hypothetical protein K1Y01_21855 [Vicinamibacteria bacterium]|nr:hypothetical protein [Vicinamibacteria bacterium]
MRGPVALMLSLAFTAGVSAQGADARFDRDAEKIFSALINIMPLRVKDEESLRVFLAPLNLKADPKAPSFEGENETGKITVTASLPRPMTGKNEFYVRLTFATAKPVPAPLLSHLLQRADNTDFSGADEITLRFASDTWAGCERRHFLVIRITTADLLEHAASIDCPPRK